MSSQNNNCAPNIAASQQRPTHMSRTQRRPLKYQHRPLHHLKFLLVDKRDSAKVPVQPGALVAALNRAQGPFKNAVCAAKFEQNTLHVSLADIDKEIIFRENLDFLNALFDVTFQIMDHYIFCVDGGDLSPCVRRKYLHMYRGRI